MYFIYSCQVDKYFYTMILPKATFSNLNLEKPYQVTIEFFENEGF